VPATELTTAAGKAARTRVRILDAAAEAFAAHGYAATSLQRIADGAGLKAGSLYFHFDSKDALIADVLHEGIQRTVTHVRAAVDALGPHASGAARVRAAIRAHLEALHELSAYAAAVIRIVDDVPPAVRAHHQATDRQYARYWTGLLRQAQAEGALPAGVDLRLTRTLLYAAMNGSTAGGASIDRVAATLVALLRLDGRPPA
jgi:AcrR family transcriptional regulator